MSSLTNVKSRGLSIKDFVDEITDAYEELWDDYLDVSQERDELLERVKELEGRNE